MDQLSVSKIENPNETSKLFWKSSKSAKLSEKKGRPNIYQDFTNLTSQLELMTESIAACQTSSRQRSLKKECNASNKRYKKWRRSIRGECFSDEGKPKLHPREHQNDLFVNYVIHDSKDFLHLRKSKTFISREEILTRCYSDESQCSERFEKYASNSNMSREFPRKSSKVGMYDYREVDSGRLIGLLQRELKTLAKLAPSAILIISNLTENLSHCQECRRCHEKISSSLPWILNRVQKLIKYVTTRRQEAYFWPNDLSYLRLNTFKSSLEEKAVGSSSSSSSRITLIPVTSPKLVGKLEKVDPIAVSEDNPGVQILLEVKPEVWKKKFLYPARPENQPKWVVHPSFPAVHLKEHTSATVVEVLKPTAKPRIVWEKKQQVAPFKEYSVSLPVVHLCNFRVPALVIVAVGEGRLIIHEKASSNIVFEGVLVESKQTESPAKSLLSILINQSEWNARELPYGIWKRTSNAKETFSKRIFRVNSSELVQDLLMEAEEADMQVQRVNELEEEVKELKDLMLEVHKNQTELGKLLLEKNVFSQLMIKLTDPKMLDEENKALKKASGTNAPSTSSSAVALQMKVDCLKRKCALKNRLIMTLLRGLRSNVPKELWEEVMAYAFDDSESVDEFDSAKINEFIRQTSLLLTNEEKERKLAPTPSRAELQSSEEEPKVKGIMGAEVEDSLKNLSCYENQASAKSKGFPSRLEGSPSRIWALPVLNVPDYAETALRKLENQISILNLENERLWHQVNELRELLKNSVNEMSMFQSDLKISRVKTSGKTINLVIQIAEKDARRPKNGRYFPPTEVEMAEARSKSSPIVGVAQNESVTAIHEAERENSPYDSDRKSAVLTAQQNYKGRSKSDRRRSENDLNCLDDGNMNIHDYKQESENLRAVLREKIYPNNRVQGLLIRTPHPSAQEIFQNFKPVVWVPSKHVIPEVCDAYGAGPSRKQGEITNVLQKPSLMELAEIQSAGMYATMSNERELQTIPENDSDSSSSKSCGVSQAIQQLRTRVRSLHKDMTVLRSKNDRIDKLLDRLMDDVVENNHNYEELESSLSSLKSRLG